MKRHPWPNILILLATIALGVLAVRWADAAFLQTEPPPKDLPPAAPARPEWIWAIYHPYRRLQHDWVWVSVAATLGVGAILALDARTWSRRGLSRPGTNVVFVTLLVGVATALQQLLAGFAAAASKSYDLGEVLGSDLPGAILGAWVVVSLGSRPHHADWREWLGRLVAWFWIVDAAMLILYAPLFG
jgi:hypothetical protein